MTDDYNARLRGEARPLCITSGLEEELAVAKQRSEILVKEREAAAETLQEAHAEARGAERLCWKALSQYNALLKKHLAILQSKRDAQ